MTFDCICWLPQLSRVKAEARLALLSATVAGVEPLIHEAMTQVEEELEVERRLSEHRRSTEVFSVTNQTSLSWLLLLQRRWSHLLGWPLLNSLPRPLPAWEGGQHSFHRGFLVVAFSSVEAKDQRSRSLRKRQCHPHIVEYKSNKQPKVDHHQVKKDATLPWTSQSKHFPSISLDCFKNI